MIILENETDDGLEVVVATPLGKEVYRTPPLAVYEVEELAENFMREAEILLEWAQERREKLNG